MEKPMVGLLAFALLAALLAAEVRKEALVAAVRMQ